VTRKRKLALLAAYHKQPGLIVFAKWLRSHGYDLIASGGTAKFLAAAEVKVQDVAEFVGGKDILGHRVVTLSRKISAGILARRNHPEDIADILRESIRLIDLLFVDLYPFKEVAKDPWTTREVAIELIDIGGPTLVREGAKAGIPTLTGYEQLEPFMTEWWPTFRSADQATKVQMQDAMSAACEFLISQYCAAVAEYHSKGELVALFGQKVDVGATYGENRWQSSLTYYRLIGDMLENPLAVHHFKLLNPGTPMGAITLIDLDRAVGTAAHAREALVKNQGVVGVVGNIPIAVAVKHGNACGAAIGVDSLDLIEKVVWGNHISIFGGVLVLNQRFTLEMAKLLLRFKVEAKEKRILAGIAAPRFSPEAIEYLQQHAGKRCKLWENPALESDLCVSHEPIIRRVTGGWLVQSPYDFVLDLSPNGPINVWPDSSEPYSVREYSALMRDLLLAWAVGSTSNSNTITLVRAGRVIGNGVGQQDRVGAAKLAIQRARDAGLDPTGAVAYSDSFFPFPDGLEVCWRQPASGPSWPLVGRLMTNW